MKKYLRIVLFLFLPVFGKAQVGKQMDSAYSMLQHATNDTVRMGAYSMLAGLYDDVNVDSGIYYCNKGIAIAEKLDLQLNKAEMLVGNYEKQIAIAHQAIPLLELAGDTVNLAGVYPDMGDGYLKLNKFDSALFCQQKSLYYYSMLPPDARKFEGSTYTSIGTIYEKMGNLDLAREAYLKAVEVSELRDNPRHTGNACLQLASLYQSLNKADSSFLYAQKAIKAFMPGGYKKELPIAYRIISDYYYAQNNRDSSFAYLRSATLLKDSLDKIDKIRLQEFQVAAFNQQLHVQQAEQNRIQKEGQLKTIAIIALIVVFSIIGLLLYRNNRQKQKTNYILQEKNSKIQEALNELKTTQKQLIQSEKMASLGELTAGIAHEIQNPLNFVNNFSEVSTELVDEMNDEINKGNIEVAREIAIDLRQNLEKINHHGKRAGDIVKGMLQHSRSSSGVKEPTDINKLADEYLRLAYHGLRAKDKSFNADFKLEADEKLPKINVIPQDIGRVLLNLINNAFYAVDKMTKENIHGYKPLVTVTTSWNPPSGGMGALISVRDNGPGIPPHIVDKIFQPFFTTKPTGQGTGLGLSLSYDIVKAHGGELKVSTKEGEGTEFIVQLNDV